MELLLGHWHCLLPVLVIGVAIFFMRDTGRQKRDGRHSSEDTMISRKDDEDL